VKERSRVELFERIRRDSRDKQLSIRELAKRHEVHRRTVRQALQDAVPPQRKTPERAAPVLGPHAATVRRWLEEDRQAPRKQRHTARRIWQRLIAEEGACVAESSVRALVRDLKAEIGIDRTQVTVPQNHLPAEEAEVDFGEFTAKIAGVITKVHMFVLRLSHSGKAVHIAYVNQAQESFLDGHVNAFETIGGVPGRIRYDNLKPAVIRVMLGRERWEHPRFIALRSHYRYDSFFCEPGIGGAHEKGGVEGEVGRFRRNHLTPVPVVADLTELNQIMAAADATEDQRRIAARAETIGQAAARELPLLTPLPGDRFDVAVVLSCRVDAKARVCVRQSYYSVPAALSGRRLQVALGARDLRVLAEGKVVATHSRSLHKGSEDLLLDHYLEILTRKPGALAGSTALATARASGAFTAGHQSFWAKARRSLGEGAGTRALIGVLLLHRTLPAEAVVAGMAAAASIGNLDPAIVAVQARSHLDAQRRTTPVPPPEHLGTDTPHARRTAGFHRATPTLSPYDQLLASTTGATS
jgi:transposase